MHTKYPLSGIPHQVPPTEDQHNNSIGEPYMSELHEQHQEAQVSSIPPFRIDVGLHELLMKSPPAAKPQFSWAHPEENALPEPLYPRRPHLLAGEDSD